jgi:hypothetical protein
MSFCRAPTHDVPRLAESDNRANAPETALPNRVANRLGTLLRPDTQFTRGALTARRKAREINRE